MTDRELLELAAKATGRKWRWTTCPKHGDTEAPGMHHRDRINNVDYYFGWNPLEDDADAFGLMVGLCLTVEVEHSPEFREYSTATTHTAQTFRENHKKNAHAATRRAIVRAAAEIGRTK